MAEASGRPALPDPNNDSCPDWCEHEHLGDGRDSDGFHHDSATTEISLENEVVPGRPLDLWINVSLHEHLGGQPESAMVEVQDDRRTLALMTPLEAVCVAQALIAAAELASGSLFGMLDLWKSQIDLTALHDVGRDVRQRVQSLTG